MCRVASLRGTQKPKYTRASPNDKSSAPLTTAMFAAPFGPQAGAPIALYKNSAPKLISKSAIVKQNLRCAAFIGPGASRFSAMAKSVA
jgi:hypothetical protein